MKQQQVTDEIINAKWQSMLRVFKTLIKDDPKPEKIKDQLEELKAAARSSIMTQRQIEGIVDRCDNYMKGEYGSTKTEENLAYGRASLNGIK